MRIDGAKPSQYAQSIREFNPSVGKKRSPEFAATPMNAAPNPALTTENLAASADKSRGAEKVERSASPGLLAVQARLQAMNTEGMTKGQLRAQEVINRNLERYLANQGSAQAAPPADTSSQPAPNTDNTAPAASNTLTDVVA